MSWKNRIVGYDNVPPEDLLANPNNFRIHNTLQQTAMLAVFEQIGWLQDVIVSVKTGFIVDGHLRVILAMRHNEPTVPVKYVDLDEDEELLALSTFDSITNSAGTDPDKLVALLTDVRADDVNLRSFLSDYATKQGVRFDERTINSLRPESSSDPEGYEQDNPLLRTSEQIDEAPDLAIDDIIDEYGIRIGKSWVITHRSSNASHIIACEDSRDAAFVTRLFGDRNGRLLWTDVPFFFKDSSSYQEGLSAVFDSCEHALLPSSPFYMLHQPGPMGIIVGQEILRHNWTIRQQLIWEKDRAIQSHSDYDYIHEPIYYGALLGSGQPGFSRTGAYLTSIFRIPIPSRNKDIPLVRPVELVSAHISVSSQPGDIVFDPFIGSGTTLIAAQDMGRVCIGIDNDPRMIALCLGRMDERGLDIQEQMM